MLFEPERRFRYKDEEINFPQHFPAWKEKNSVEPIKFSITLQVDRVRDSAIFKLADEFFKIGEDVPSITLHLSAEYNRDKDQPELVATHCENLLDSFKSRTLFKTIRNSGAFQFYNSTEPEDPFGPRNQLTDLFGELSKADREQLVKDRDKLSKTISSF